MLFPRWWCRPRAHQRCRAIDRLERGHIQSKGCCASSGRFPGLLPRSAKNLFCTLSRTDTPCDHCANRMFYSINLPPLCPCFCFPLQGSQDQEEPRHLWVQKISEKPRAFIFRNFLSDAESSHVIKLARHQVSVCAHISKIHVKRDLLVSHFTITVPSYDGGVQLYIHH